VIDTGSDIPLVSTQNRDTIKSGYWTCNIWLKKGGANVNIF